MRSRRTGHSLHIGAPLLTNHTCTDRVGDRGGVRSTRLSLLYTVADDPAACPARSPAVRRRGRGDRRGATSSQRSAPERDSPRSGAARPAAVQQHLTRLGIRMQAGLIVETGEAREVHDVALLVGYGAAAVNPYLALDTVRAMAAAGELGDVAPDEAERRYIAAIADGLLKVMSKMGISTVHPTAGADLRGGRARPRPSIAIHRHAVAHGRRRAGRAAPRGARASRARFQSGGALTAGGQYSGGPTASPSETRKPSRRCRPRSGRSATTCSPITAPGRRRGCALCTCAACSSLSRRSRCRSKRWDGLPRSSALRHRREVVRLDQRRAHETLAIAMNRSAASHRRGGEVERRYEPAKRRSAPQRDQAGCVGRFGVTATYLVNADELQIKVAQGASRARAGSLPATRSTSASRACATRAGRELISPPRTTTSTRSRPQAAHL